MILANYNTKQIYFKAYQHLSQLENALKYLNSEDSCNFQISILGRTSQFYQDKDIEVAKDITLIKEHWKNLLGNSVNFGSFYNPQIGTVFIVGNLVSTFLHQINGKPLATLSSGSYGIFRGIGASEIEATNYIKLLNTGDFLLVFRGFEEELHNLDTLLNTFAM